MPISAPPSPDRDIEVGLTAVAEVNRVIAAADAKAGFLLAAQGVVLAGMAASLRTGVALPPPLRVGAIVVCVVAGVVIALLVASLWPRTSAPIARWFAYPALRPAADGSVPARPDVDALAGQAWAQAHALAAIARRKYRWLRGALLLAAVDLIAFTAWVAATVGASGPQ